MEQSKKSIKKAQNSDYWIIEYFYCIFFICQFSRKFFDSKLAYQHIKLISAHKTLKFHL